MPNATIITRDLNGIALTARADRLPLILFNEGVLETAAFDVTGSSGMAVTVGSGAANSDHAVVAGDDASGQGNYIVEMTDATVNVPLSAADGSNPRIDLIVLKVRDDDHDSGGQNLTDVEVVEGTPAASPSVPSLPTSAISLAEVTVATGTTLIKPAQISDTRQQVTRRGQFEKAVVMDKDEFDSPVAISTTEAVNVTVTLAIPAYWSTYDVELIASSQLADGGAAASALYTGRIRRTSLGGALIEQSSQELQISNNLDVINFNMLGALIGETATGNVVFVYTRDISTENNNYDIDQVTFTGKAIRTS